MKDAGRPIRSRMDQGLQKSIAHDGYVVDAQAVAEAMLARSRIALTGSGMLEASKALEGTSFRVPEGNSAARENGS